MSEPGPPHTSIPSIEWEYLPSGMSGSSQCWPVEGIYTSTDCSTTLDGKPPDMISPEYKIFIILTHVTFTIGTLDVGRKFFENIDLDPILNLIYVYLFNKYVYSVSKGKHL